MIEMPRFLARNISDSGGKGSVDAEKLATRSYSTWSSLHVGDKLYIFVSIPCHMFRPALVFKGD